MNEPAGERAGDMTEWFRLFVCVAGGIYAAYRLAQPGAPARRRLYEAVLLLAFAVGAVLSLGALLARH
jgi:hypothetical protein